MPELPSDMKSLVYPLEPSRFIQYVPTSLERNHKHELLAETDVGVEVDLIDPEIFKVDRMAKIHPDDERLLEDEESTAAAARSSRHQKTVSWLRKTEYISTELYNKRNKAERVESKLGFSAKRRLQEEIVYRDRESQIKAIEKTFESAKNSIKKHYSKPNVHAVEVLPVLPDFTLWRFPCAQVIFDDDPSRRPNESTGKNEVNQAMIRGMVDESGDHFVAYFLPTDQTREQHQVDVEQQVPFTEGAVYEYELAREYNWNVKNKAMANYEENYFFVFRNDGVYYNELETRVRLSKRRKMNPSVGGPSSSSGNRASTLKTRLLVKHREFTDVELKSQTDRNCMLENVNEEEEEVSNIDDEDQASFKASDEDGPDQEEYEDDDDDDRTEDGRDGGCDQENRDVVSNEEDVNDDEEEVTDHNQQHHEEDEEGSERSSPAVAASSTSSLSPSPSPRAASRPTTKPDASMSRSSRGGDISRSQKRNRQPSPTSSLSSLDDDSDV